MKATLPARRPGRPRSVESERSILDATMELLVAGGFAGLTLDRVAARARASKSTIYRRWPTKEHLMIAVASRWPPLVAREKGGALAELCDLHAQLLRTLHSPQIQGLFAMLAAERIRNPELAAALDPLMERRREPVLTVLQRAVRRGELPADADIAAGADTLASVTTARLYDPHGSLGMKAMRRIFRLVLRGLGAKSQPNVGRRKR